MWVRIIAVIGFLSIIGAKQLNEGTHPKRIFSKDFLEKAKELQSNLKVDPTYISVPDMIVSHGYPVEIHKVVTEDGYILTMHRIPHGKHEKKKPKTPRQPVFLQHGLISSSATWILNTSDIAPAYIFADAGYDVWLGNARGNEYSMAHKYLDPSSYKFWDFSWTEMGKYDIPAVIDDILKKTSHKKLIYVGHSMGTTMFWAAMNEHPELNEKILVMFGLGPVSYLNHMKSPIKYFSRVYNLIDDMSWYIGEYQFFPNNSLFKLWTKYFCNLFKLEERLCEVGIFVLTGFDFKNFDIKLLPLVTTHLNSGTSLNTVNHFAQLYESGKFQKYDHGQNENLQKYGQPTPPEYHLNMVTAPVYLMIGDNDWLADPDDADRLITELPSGVRHEQVPFKDFNHLDFLIGNNAPVLIYDKILKLIPEYEKKNKLVENGMMLRAPEKDIDFKELDNLLLKRLMEIIRSHKKSQPSVMYLD